jgi:hypothetical protein
METGHLLLRFEIVFQSIDVQLEGVLVTAEFT